MRFPCSYVQKWVIPNLDLIYLMCMYICTCVCVYVYMYMCMCVCIYVHVYVCFFSLNSKNEYKDYKGNTHNRRRSLYGMFHAAIEKRTKKRRKKERLFYNNIDTKDLTKIKQ